MKLVLLKGAMVGLIVLSGLSSNQVGAATVEVSSCTDWETAVNATLDEDTTAVITASSFSYDDCGESTYKTFEVKNNLLKVESDAAWRKLCKFWGIRFEVTDNGHLSFGMDAEFNMGEDKELEVNGGLMYVESGSTARFLEDLDVTGFHVIGERDEDYSGEIFDGGCVWNEGYFRVNGHATFTSCDNDNIRGTAIGLGFAIYNGAAGSILFKDGVTVQDMYMNDIWEDNGAIYNAGKIDINGDSVFLDIVADNVDGNEVGIAIYNEENATFTFKQDASATFVECRGINRQAGAVRNKGMFTFSGPANFTQCQSAIYNTYPGSLVLSDGSVFSKNFNVGPYAGGAITNLVGATLEIPEDITFTNNSVNNNSFCDNIYFQHTEGVYQTHWVAEDYTCPP